jgi:hypothetical protein
MVAYKVFILFMTSLIGTWMIYLGTVEFFPPGSEKWSWILYIVLLAIFILVQVGARRDDPVKREKEKRRRKK